jgi:hypothetical protein
MEQPDALEKGIRLGCGVIAGLCIGACAGLRLFEDDVWPAIAVMIAIAVIFGLAARYLGDRFWHWLVALLSWL